MAKQDRFEMEGTIVDINRDIFLVEIEMKDKKINIPCTISGKLRMNNIKLIKGDSVVIDLNVADVTRGRIIWRNK